LQHWICDFSRACAGVCFFVCVCLGDIILPMCHRSHGLLSAKPRHSSLHRSVYASPWRRAYGAPRIM
jgi:hypothetical protein